ncbi:MAG: DMT family transporter [Alphaproteobacteria bacterium]|nr:DMT family transporter [Alphaproteobacteria bacterium]
MNIDARFFALAVFGIALLTGMDALAKALAGGYGTFQIVFFRYAVSLLLFAAAIPLLRPEWPRRERLGAHAARAVLTIVTGATFFYALGKLPFTEVFAIAYTGPIFVALFGALLLGEKVRWPTMAAIACGFAGVLVIAADGPAGGGDTQQYLALACAIASPVSYALGVVLLRSQTLHESVPTILIVQAAMITLGLAIVAGPRFTMPDGADLWAIGGIGLLGAAGIYAFSAAIAKLQAAQVAAADYSGLIWAAMLGYVAFGETPRPAMWIGALLILAGSATMLLVKARAAKKP